jgi:Protein of unknown function (DUF3383)
MPAQGIPAAQIANVIPGVLAAGGSGLDLVGLCLTDSTRVPIGEVLGFASPDDVGAYFGFESDEFDAAGTYFLGFNGSTILPGTMIFAQYPWAGPVAPYLRGGDIASTTTLAQLKAIAPGELAITVNGTEWTSSSINLAGATSFSNAASIIQTALGINDCSFTGVIAEETASVTGSIAGDVLTVSAVGSGVLVIGGVLSGSGVAAGTAILNQVTGTPGGVGTYTVSIGNQSVSSTTITEDWGQLTASSLTGAIWPGQTVLGSGVAADSIVTAQLTGSPGGAGTYVAPYQAVSSEAMTSGAATVTFDSVSGAFVITGGTPGTVGTITYGSGAIATSLMLTAATGAVLSQGAPQATPIPFMTGLFNAFQNFGSFFTIFQPVTADALAFAQWTNGQETEVVYSFWDNSVENTEADPQTAGAAIIAAGYSGVSLFYAPQSTFLDAAMICGMIGSINFQQTNGRVTFAFRSQDGMPPEVTSGEIAQQLIANGMNFYGTYSTPSENFTWVYPGTVTGQFLWLDSYVNACWLKNLLQNAIMALFQAVGSIPFNAAGYAIVAEALGGGPATGGQPAGPIQQALAFGAIRSGVQLSSTQIAAINNQAGLGVATVLQTQGWYLLIQPSSPAVRQARGPLQITLFYTDGESIQSIVLNTVNLL